MPQSLIITHWAHHHYLQIIQSMFEHGPSEAAEAIVALGQLHPESTLRKQINNWLIQYIITYTQQYSDTLRSGNDSPTKTHQHVRKHRSGNDEAIPEAPTTNVVTPDEENPKPFAMIEIHPEHRSPYDQQLIELHQHLDQLSQATHQLKQTSEFQNLVEQVTDIFVTLRQEIQNLLPESDPSRPQVITNSRTRDQIKEVISDNLGPALLELSSDDLNTFKAQSSPQDSGGVSTEHSSKQPCIVKQIISKLCQVAAPEFQDKDFKVISAGTLQAVESKICTVVQSKAFINCLDSKEALVKRYEKIRISGPETSQQMPMIRTIKPYFPGSSNQASFNPERSGPHRPTMGGPT